MPFPEKIANWRDQAGPIGVEPLTSEQLRKKAAKDAAMNKGRGEKKSADDQFDKGDLSVIRAVND
jgi:hypothetical protein